MPDDSRTTEPVEPIDTTSERVDQTAAQSTQRPWRVQHTNKHFFQILDAVGNRICDFFPEAPGALPRAELLSIAERIVQRENENAE